MDRLTARGRAIRLAITGIAAAVLLAGTVWGHDDDFPFGPFVMYAFAPGTDAPVPDLRLEGVDTTGATIALTERNTGIRRAEIEGQRQRYAADPTLLRRVAQAYAEHQPGSPAVVEVRIVIRWYGVRHARPTGRYVDETVQQWRA